MNPSEAKHGYTRSKLPQSQHTSGNRLVHRQNSFSQHCASSSRCRFPIRWLIRRRGLLESERDERSIKHRKAMGTHFLIRSCIATERSQGVEGQTRKRRRCSGCSSRARKRKRCCKQGRVQRRLRRHKQHFCVQLLLLKQNESRLKSKSDSISFV